MDDAQKIIAEATRAGHDLSLIDVNLALSYEERALRHDSALELMLAFREAGRALYARAAKSFAG